MSLHENLERFQCLSTKYNTVWAVKDLPDLAADPVIAAALVRVEIGQLAIEARVRDLREENDL